MQAGECTFTKFISGEVTLVIPVYQRNYDWRKANCEQLFNDIVGIIKNKKPHFIGTFVYQHEVAGVGAPQEYIIIDGQQRITSIILFAKALYDLNEDEDLRNDMRAKFIKHTTGKNIRNKCRLRPNEFDRATFEKLMADDGFDESDFSEPEKNSPMYLNYRFFCEKINASTLTHEDFCDAIDRLNVVSILLKEENPQEIFESLNSTGLDLTKADLIRNFLLMPLSYDLQEELYKNYWLKMEELLRPSDNVENFLVQYLITKRRSDSVMETKKQRLSNRNLYAVFKEYFSENYSDAEPCLKDMYRYSKFFRRVIFNDETKFANLSALDKKFYELTFLLKADNAPIILMYLLDRCEQNHFDEATFIKFVDALISLVFRAKICGNSGITSQFAGNVLARLDKENPLNEKTFWQIITFGKGRYAFPADKDFQAALVSNNLYETIKSDGCRYLLYSLERANQAKELPPYSDSTVEHILPQKLNVVWENYLEVHNDTSAHEIWLHTLGNLTLTAYNTELGNKEFDIKKEFYSQSNYPGTRALAECSDWTSKQIQARAKKLAAVAVKVWTLPEEFNKALPNKNEMLTLDSDFDALKGTHPATLSVFGTEMKMPYWNWMLREIVRQLYALDGDTFRRATQRENVPKSLFPTEPTDFEIDAGFYMDTGFSTKDCLRIAKLLVENFDRIGDTNVKDEIWFTLKPQEQ